MCETEHGQLIPLDFYLFDVALERIATLFHLVVRTIGQHISEGKISSPITQIQATLGNMRHGNTVYRKVEIFAEILCCKHVLHQRGWSHVNGE